MKLLTQIRVLFTTNRVLLTSIRVSCDLTVNIAAHVIVVVCPVLLIFNQHPLLIRQISALLLLRMRLSTTVIAGPAGLIEIGESYLSSFHLI